jgi:hypothetical protein
MKRRRPLGERPVAAGRRNATPDPSSPERGVGCSATPVAPIPTPLWLASVAFLVILDGLLHRAARRTACGAFEKRRRQRREDRPPLSRGGGESI